MNGNTTDPRSESDALSVFHPLTAAWFRETFGTPTDIQSQAWPAVARGEHVLITAPTGSGKTLTAFLWALDCLITGRWERGTVRVLYVSPLKALNTDIRRNLERPLAGLRAAFAKAGVPFPEISVLTRSGDTPQNERRRMTKHPPEIFITTPESLNLILSSKNARHMLDGVRVVILDEIHSIAAGKRGTFLMSAVERITLLSGEFQRIAISATVTPLSTVAGFTGGFIAEGEGPGARYTGRPVTILRSTAKKTWDISVRLPAEGFHGAEAGSVWPVFARDFREIIRANRSSLFFTNTRRHAEKLTFLLNENEPHEIAWSHHGSLSKEIRRVVEERLKNGELAAIVATSSLELGIDIGELDEVVLVETPPTVSAALQRIGRAGHGVGRTSRGTLYPLHGRDLVDAATMVEALREGAIEETRPVEMPLDILAQVIVSMTGVEEWNADSLYGFLRTVYPYRNLSRKLYDLVLEMLAGRYADSRVRELRPRISWDRVDGSVRAVDGALSLVYSSGGTIPDRGSYTIRLQGSGAKIGELDEEFVWERHVGDTFPLGAQNWKITRIDQQNVEVSAWNGTGGIFPFWRAESRYRDYSYMGKTAEFLETWNDSLESPEFEAELRTRRLMNGPAARETIDFLLSQKQVTGRPLPHRHHVLVERHRGMLEQADTDQYIIHTLWGGKVNFPLSLILTALWEERSGNDAPEVYADNDAVIFVVPADGGEPDVEGLLSRAADEASRGGTAVIEDRLRKKLEGTGFFGARFRENAGRALLLPRGGLGKRTPLWLTRLRSKKLLDSIMRYEDFPILIETWRSCLQDDLDIPALAGLLDELHRGEIAVTRAETIVPSPFARNLIWTTTNVFVYENDRPLPGKGAGLSGDILREAVFTPHLRPRIARGAVEAFEARLRRTAAGYAPDTIRETVDWVKERLLVPRDEWEALLSVMRTDSPELFQDQPDPGAGPAAHPTPQDDRFLGEAGERLVRVSLPGSRLPSVAAVESIPRLLPLFGVPAAEWRNVAGSLSPGSRLPEAFSIPGPDSGDSETGQPDGPGIEGFLLEWLRYSGPVPVTRLSAITGIDTDSLTGTCETLAGNGDLILDFLTEDAGELQVCDPENLESLLRISRSGRRASFSALPADHLQLFLAEHQGLVRDDPDRNDDLRSMIEQLFGYTAAPELWESEIFPARLSPYYPAWLDSLFRESELIWFRAGKTSVGFCFRDDYELFAEPGERVPSGERSRLLELLDRMHDLHELQAASGLALPELRSALADALGDGDVTTDTFDTVRRGLPEPAGTREPGSGADDVPPRGSAFRSSVELPSEPPAFGSLSGYRSRMRRQGGWAPVRAPEEKWFRIASGPRDYDALDREELVRDRVRQLLLRYGVLFRQLLEYELPVLSWQALWRSLRLMELSGEILSGRFFEGVPGPQFASHEAFRRLVKASRRTEADPGRVYFMNAQDPASLCGMGIGELKQKLPPRVSSTHLVFRESSLVLVSRRLGRDLEFLVPPDDRRIPEYLAFLDMLSTRKTSPVKIHVETVNGEPVRNSPYAEKLIEAGFSRDYKAFHLRGRIRTRNTDGSRGP